MKFTGSNNSHPVGFPGRFSSGTDKRIGLSPFRAVGALATTGDVRVAAKPAQVSERTLRRWLTQPEFQAELNKAETELVRTATRRLERLVSKALGILEAVMDDKKVADNPRSRGITWKYR